MLILGWEEGLLLPAHQRRIVVGQTTPQADAALPSISSKPTIVSYVASSSTSALSVVLYRDWVVDHFFLSSSSRPPFVIHELI